MSNIASCVTGTFTIGEFFLNSGMKKYVVLWIIQL